MNKEEIINILIEELGLTNYIKVADYLINLETTIIKLQEENEKLKADYGNKAQVERDLLKEENEKLKAELQLYQGALKREDEAIHRVNDLEEENQELKEEINKISKKELKVRDMLYSIENGTLTRERLIQIEEVLFEFGDSNELGYADINARNERKYLRNE